MDKLKTQNKILIGGLIIVILLNILFKVFLNWFYLDNLNMNLKYDIYYYLIFDKILRIAWATNKIQEKSLRAQLAFLNAYWSYAIWSSWSEKPIQFLKSYTAYWNCCRWCRYWVSCQTQNILVNHLALPPKIYQWYFHMSIWINLWLLILITINK